MLGTTEESAENRALPSCLWNFKTSKMYSRYATYSE